MTRATATVCALTFLIGGCGARSAMLPAQQHGDGAPLDQGGPVDGSESDQSRDAAQDVDGIVAPKECLPPALVTRTGNSCTVKLTVSKVTPSSLSCFVDVVIKEQMKGMLQYPCAGTGGATIAFGSNLFKGTINGCQVDTTHNTQFVWSDGCTWRSTQKIGGLLSKRTLAYTYSEKPLAGQSNCARYPPCHATGVLKL